MTSDIPTIQRFVQPVLCPACKGRKQVLSNGNMGYQDCRLCTVATHVVDVVDVLNASNAPIPIKVKRKRVRMPQAVTESTEDGQVITVQIE